MKRRRPRFSWSHLHHTTPPSPPPLPHGLPFLTSSRVLRKGGGSSGLCQVLMLCTVLNDDFVLNECMLLLLLMMMLSLFYFFSSLASNKECLSDYEECFDKKTDFMYVYIHMGVYIWMSEYSYAHTYLWHAWRCLKKNVFFFKINFPEGAGLSCAC